MMKNCVCCKQWCSSTVVLSLIQGAPLSSDVTELLLLAQLDLPHIHIISKHVKQRGYNFQCLYILT